MHARDAEELVRPLLWIGFDGKIPTPEAARLIHEGVSGVILFARNVGTSDETRTLIRELKAIAPGPLLLSVDQEGGRVARLTEGFTKFPSLRELGGKSPGEVREIGRQLGAEVRGAGFDIDLAPVVERLADHFDLAVVSVSDSGGDEWWVYSSTWMLLSRDGRVLEREPIVEASDPCGKGAGHPLWSDDFASVWTILVP